MVALKCLIVLFLSLSVSYAQDSFDPDVNWSEFREVQTAPNLTRLEHPAAARRQAWVNVDWSKANWNAYGFEALGQFKVYGRYHFVPQEVVRRGDEAQYQLASIKFGADLFRNASVYRTETSGLARIDDWQGTYSTAFPEELFANVFERTEDLQNPFILLEYALRDPSPEGVESILESFERHGVRKIFISVFDNRDSRLRKRAEARTLDDLLRWEIGANLVTVAEGERHLLLKVAYLSDGTVLVPSIIELATLFHRSPGDWFLTLSDIERKVGLAERTKNVPMMTQAHQSLLEYAELRMLFQNPEVFGSWTKPENKSEIDGAIVNALENWRYQSQRMDDLISRMEEFFKILRER